MNLTGAFPSCQAVARFMIRRWPEAIINVGSLSARIGNNRQKQTRFSAATAVVHLLTKCLAVEWAPHSIWVNALLPGGIHNGLLDPNVTRDQQHVEEYWRNPAAQDWFGRPEELASTVAYRSPDASTLLTSGEMAVCGGFSCADIPQEALS